MFTGMLVLAVLCALLPAAQAGCPYWDAYWRVSYSRGGLVKWSETNTPEPPSVQQAGPASIAVSSSSLLSALLYCTVLQVSWGHLVADAHCVDRFILQVWDTRPRLVRYIYNSSAAERAVVPAPPCTRLQVQVGDTQADIQQIPVVRCRWSCRRTTTGQESRRTPR